MVSTRDNSATTESRNQADDVEAGWYVLGDDIGFICGHGPGGRFGEERRTNPFLT